MSLSAGYRPWNYWFKIIRCFFVYRRKIPLYSLSDAGAHWYSNNQVTWDLTVKRACLSGVLAKDFLNYFLLFQINFFLLHIITNYLTTTVCNFTRSVLTKHISKNIRGESTFSKICDYRTATSLKRDFDTDVFLWVCKQLFYSFFTACEQHM